MKATQKQVFQTMLTAASGSGARQNLIFLQAESGRGKSYLLRAAEAHLKNGTQEPPVKVRYVTADDFTSELIDAYRNGSVESFRKTYGSLDVLMVDDVECMAGREATQTHFLEILDQIHPAGGTVVLAGIGLPELLKNRDWMVLEPELPDLEDRMQILRGKAEKLGISVEEEVLQLIAETVYSDLRAMEGMLSRVAAYAELMGRRPDRKLAEEILKEAQ